MQNPSVAYGIFTSYLCTRKCVRFRCCIWDSSTVAQAASNTSWPTPAPVQNASVSRSVMASPASDVAVTSEGESAASRAFCSRSAGASMRAYAGSPCRAAYAVSRDEWSSWHAHGGRRQHLFHGHRHRRDYNSSMGCKRAAIRGRKTLPLPRPPPRLRTAQLLHVATLQHLRNPASCDLAFPTPY